MWPLTTVTSGPLIPVAVPEAATQACNFQAGLRPGVTPLLNQSLNQTYLIISWLPLSSVASRKWRTGACLLLGKPGAQAGSSLASSPTLPSSPELSCLELPHPHLQPPSTSLINLKPFWLHPMG